MKTFFLVILFFLCAIAYPQEPGAGNTLRFDGNSTRIIHEPLFNNAELPITLSYWMKINGTPRSVERIFNSCYTPDNIYYGFSSNYSTGGVNINFGDGRGPLEPSFRRGKKYSFANDISDRWIHVAISVRGSRDMSIFINGIDVGGNYSGSGLSMAVNSACKTIIGFGTDNNGEQFLRGELDEIRVWNYSRSTEQIRMDMTRKLDGNESGLIGYWSFDEGTGSVINEMVSNSEGAIEGSANWVLSGAPIGDESFFEYFPAETKRKLFIHEQDSFWISTESDNWVGYHVYKVSEPPNTDEGSAIDLSNGYYGVYPIFENEESGEYRIDFGNAECAIGDFRNGNSDLSWEEVVEKSDSSLQINQSEIVEFAFDSEGAINPISSIYFLCEGESVIINSESSIVSNYNWFDSSTESEIEIFNPGQYWLERASICGTLRENFSVELFNYESDFLSEDSFSICKGDLPLILKSNLNQNVIWNTGDRDSSILVNLSGIYWAEYETNCGVIRDSVIVEIAELNNAFIPNVITPNNDSVNDCFLIGAELIGSQLRVFNRAGIEVYNSENYDNNWCPLNIPSGTYFYQISNTCFKEYFKGWLSVLK